VEREEHGVIAGELYTVYSSHEAPSSSMDELSWQGLIGALVDLDLDYEREREVLSRSPLGATLKARLLTKVKDRYRIRRQPYMRQLAVLLELT